MEDFPTRIADYLEQITDKIRSMSVDRAARVLTFVALGLVGAMLVSLAFVFLLVGLMRIAGELVRKVYDGSLSMEIAYAIVGGLFLAAGALLWTKRTKSSPPEETA